MEEQYLGPLQDSLGLTALAVLAALAALLGATGGIFGLALVRKHFAKAGLA